MANDIKALDWLFWASPQTVRYGVGENLYGEDEIMAFRKARLGGSPQRVLTRTVITTFGRDFATANAEFRREGDGPCRPAEPRLGASARRLAHRRGPRVVQGRDVMSHGLHPVLERAVLVGPQSRGE